MTIYSRRYNRDRLAAQANAKELKVGDTVMLKAEPDRLPLTGRWDPKFEVVRVMDLICEIREQSTGKTKIVNRERVYLVDPNMAWEGIAPRPKRKRNIAKRPLVRNNREIAQPENETRVPIPEEEEAYRQPHVQPNPTNADATPRERITRLNKRRMREGRKRHPDPQTSSDEKVMPRKIQRNRLIRTRFARNIATSPTANKKRAAHSSSDDDSTNREFKPRAAKTRALAALRDNSNNEQNNDTFTTRETRQRGRDQDSPQRERSRSREGRRDSGEEDRGETHGARHSLKG